MPQGFSRRVIGGLLAASILLIIWRTSSQYQQQPLNPSIVYDHRPDTNTPAIHNGDIKVPDVKIPDVKIPDVKTNKPSDDKIPDVKTPDFTTSNDKISDVKAPDVKIPDVKTSDDKFPDEKNSDSKTSDVKTEKPKDVEVPRRRVGKVSMFYGFQNPYYERALESHKRHAERWNYPMYILEEDIAVGYWNKPSYVLSLVIQELAKVPEERLEWLMLVSTLFFSESRLIILGGLMPTRSSSTLRFRPIFSSHPPICRKSISSLRKTRTVSILELCFSTCTRGPSACWSRRSPSLSISLNKI
jgi:hypothetical protein